MEQKAEKAPEQGGLSAADSTAAEKLDAAFGLLTAAFQDSRTDALGLTKDDLIDQVVAAQRVLNTVWALQSARLAQAGAIEDTFTPDSRDPRGFRDPQVRHAIGSFQAEFIGADIGPRLGWTTGHARARVQEATDAITRTPRLFGRVGTGEVEPAKLAAVHRALGRVFRGTAEDGTPATLDGSRAVEAALLGDADDPDAPGITDAGAAAAEQAGVDLLARQSAGQVQHRTARILSTMDPVAAGRAAVARRRDRIGVFAHPDDEPGLSHLHAILPAAVAAKVMTAVDRHARDLHADTTTDKTLAECRADALTDLVLANATVTTHLVVQIPVHTGSRPPFNGESGRSGAFAHPVTGLSGFASGCPAPSPASSAGPVVKSQDTIDREFNDLLKRLYPPDLGGCADWELDDPSDSAGRWRPPDDIRSADIPPNATEPVDAQPVDAQPVDTAREPRATAARLGDATVPGIGVIPASVIEAMSRSFGTTMTRALVDAGTGTTLETCETRYRPSARLQHFVRTRDGHCRFPGCTRAARWCDIDHVDAWPRGRTAADNLQCLCRHHHRTKQAHGWSVVMTPLGVCTWTSPTGRTYVTTPGE